MAAFVVPHFTFFRLTRPRASAVCRPTPDDVDRLSRGLAAQRRGTGSRAIPHRLNAEERSAYERGVRDGYLTLWNNVGHRRERKGSPLFNIWRMWNDAHAVPAIVMVKRGQQRLAEMDEVWIDLSTLRGEVGGIAPSLTDVVRALDHHLGRGSALEDDALQIVNSNESIVLEGELLPTWRIPEIIVKYQYEDRREAKNDAKSIAHRLGCGWPAPKKVSKAPKSKRIRFSEDETWTF